MALTRAGAPEHGGLLWATAERRAVTLVTALTALVGLTVALLLVPPLLRLPLLVARDYNEGWNAYQALYAVTGGTLYPEATALITNNYPPLSFYIVGGLGVLVGDNVIAGRIVALASLLVVTLNIGLIVRRLGGSSTVAAFGALLFLGYIAARASGYVATNDPQWLAHALMTTGLVLVLRGGSAALAVAAVLMLAAGLVKHLLIPLPLAVTLWLAFTDRGRLRVWLGVSLPLTLAALLGLYAAYGPNVFAGILEGHRQLSIGAMAYKIDAWLVPLLPALGASVLLLLLKGRDHGVQLLALYALLAGLWCVFVWSGAGVHMNAAFDLMIAAFIGAAVAVDRLKAWSTDARIGPSARIAAMAILALMVLLPAPYRSGHDLRALRQLDELRASAAADIAFLAGQTGPVMCENLALCYWAGQPFEVDMFNTGQKLFTGVLPQPEFLRLLDEGRFAVVQLYAVDGQPRTDRLPAAVNERLAATYAVRRVSPTGGLFLTPADSTAAAAR